MSNVSVKKSVEYKLDLGNHSFVSVRVGDILPQITVRNYSTDQREDSSSTVRLTSNQIRELADIFAEAVEGLDS